MKISHPLILRIRQYRLIALQLALVVVANRAAFVLRFDGHEPAWAVDAWLQMLPWLVVIRGIAFAPFRLYQGRWRYTSVYELKAIVEAVAVSSLLFAAVASSPAGPAVYPRSVFVVDAILLMIALGGVRVARRLYVEFSTRSTGKRLLIIGAGDAGETLVRDIRASADNEYQPIGFIDDDATKAGHRIHDVPVLGTRQDLPRILSTHQPDEVLIAIPSADPGLLRAIVRSLEPHRIPIKTLPQLREIVGRVELRQIRTLGFEDLLARAPVGIDRAPLDRLIAGRRVLVTGAGGSIGGELCRQIAGMSPASLVMLDRYENGLHALHVELQDRPHAFAFHQVIGDVTDATRVNAVFTQYQPEIVFHAAAHKHVPLMEDNPCEAIKNNVTGSRIVAEAAERHAADRFILISTDKAVNPISVMGASKRLAELVVRARAVGSATTFATVRFGNVLGSNGSVVPRFLDQIQKGGPVTVTHPEVRRFFMLIPEAVQLVLHAAAQANNGATYVLEMGEQVKLVDMARHLIRLSGFVPEDEIAIKFIGLRPGEKLAEELVGDGETTRPSRVEKILRVSSAVLPSAELLRGIRAIEEQAWGSDTAAVMTLVGRLLPGYNRARPDTSLDAWRDPVFDEPMSSAQEEAIAYPARVAAVCHNCRSGRLYRSHARTLLERVVRAVGDKRLFTCDECNWRGWLVPVDVGVTVSGSALMRPDLGEIDAAVALTPFFPGRTPPSNLN
jgi:FlaA1/EpsC-like NDP-sugar epimerase